MRGGNSFGIFVSVSAKGLMSFGLETVASNLHQVTYKVEWYISSSSIIHEEEKTYAFMFNMGLLDLKPARAHYLALEHQKLKCASTSTKYPSDIGARSIIG